MREQLPGALPGLLRYARTVTRGGPDPEGRAQDLVQETVVRALQSAATFRQESSLSTWLHRILYRLALDEAKRRREVPVPQVDDDAVAASVENHWRSDEYTVDAAAVVTRAETRHELEDALVHLPATYRSAVVLHDALGLSVPQVAEIQEVSLAAAKQRVRRGRLMLVSELGRGYERRQALQGVPLRCWEVRSKVSDLLDGELDQPTVAVMSAHLSACPTCPPLYAALSASTETLRSTARDPDSVIPLELVQRLGAYLDRPAPQGRGSANVT